MPPASRFVQLGVVRSQLAPLAPFQASSLGVAVITMSIEGLAVLLLRVAATPGGGDNWKFARLPSGVPGYLIRENVQTFKPVWVILITMFVPGAEMPPAALMTNAVGLAVTVP